MVVDGLFLCSSGAIDFLEFCQVSGIHNVSERLKRKYVPDYEEVESDEEDPEVVTRRILRTDAYEDNEAFVGHPGEEITRRACRNICMWDAGWQNML